ncbi:hypothetical protein GQ457_05G014870 [Hibiscus cannabinus]
MREEGEEISGKHERGDPSGSEPQAKQVHALDPLFHYFGLESSKEASKRPKFPSWPLRFLVADLDIPPWSSESPIARNLCAVNGKLSSSPFLSLFLIYANLEYLFWDLVMFGWWMVDGGFGSMGAGLGEQLEEVAQWRLVRWVLGKGGVFLKSLKA